MRTGFRGIQHETLVTHSKGRGRLEKRRHFLINDPEELEYFNKTDVRRFAHAVRQHWGIENSLHGVLDVTFHEDLSRARIAAQPENPSVLRHFALNLIKWETSTKDSLRGKRQRASWSDDYVLQILLACATSPAS